MKLSDLSLPFKESEIEWRVGSCGLKKNGKPWAMVLAYVQARAVMDRLDSVCGPENWRASYRFDGGGVVCKLEINTMVCGWIAKEDGSEPSEIESFKGGISGALKRAASVWGIGRYLYSLESDFATMCDRDTEGAKYGKTKEGTVFHWVPPSLPAWALPPTEKEKPQPKQQGVFPEQPAPGDGVQFPDNEFCFPAMAIPLGYLARKPISKTEEKDLKRVIEVLTEKYGKGNWPEGAEFTVEECYKELDRRGIK
jgi:hypothetical protein